MLKLAFSERLGRIIRQDDASTLGISTQTFCEEAIREGRTEDALALLDYFRLEQKTMHDFLVSWINDLKGFMASRLGEESIVDALRVTYEKAWKTRYQSWDELTAEEKLQISVEGMRGHLSGPGRRGDVLIAEEEDRWVLRFDPCGSGGVLRRGDPETGRPPAPFLVTLEEHDWTWGRKEVPFYCTHCCIVMEKLTGEEFGVPLRPLEFDPDPNKPCTWYIYKHRDLTRAEHFERVGLKKPQ